MFQIKYKEVKCWADGPDGEVAVIGIRDDAILLAIPVQKLKSHMRANVKTISHEEWKQSYTRRQS